jgi:hypothetical protein
MTSKLGYRALVIAVLGACALAQDQGQPRTVAGVTGMPADNVPSTTSRRQKLESRDRSPVATNPSSPYYWKTAPVGESAQLLTLFCGTCDVLEGIEQDVPLVSVVRDTLGDQTSENDRVTYVWLLTYARPRVRQRILSAIPFFYWRLGKGSESLSAHEIAPFMDLSAPENPMMARVEQNLMQWTAFDPMTTSVRASTLEYNGNSLDNTRQHLEEAISYLRQAPVSDNDTALTQAQLDTVVARLELRKTLLGGLASENQATRVGMQSDFERERIRSRNLELLRQWAEKAGLIFEPLNLTGNKDHYAILGFSQKDSVPRGGSSLNSIWKLLGIRNPTDDGRSKTWAGLVHERSLDENGSQEFVPLAVYSLDYPKQPLMLIDFRHKLSGRRREVGQRSVDELMAGVLGISHFTSWYLYVAFDLHRFVVGRRGTALDEASRLDCYSDFRMQLALDRSIDPAFKEDMGKRIRWLAVNPLEAAPQREIQNAFVRYNLLELEAKDGRLMARIDHERRFELSSFGEGEKTKLAKSMLHVATLGLYRDQAERNDIFTLDRERRVTYQLSLLDPLVQSETPPEIAYDSQRIKASVRELSSLMPAISSSAVRSHAEATLARLKNLSKDNELQAECTTALVLMKQTDAFTTVRRAGVAAFSNSTVGAFSSGGSK